MNSKEERDFLEALAGRPVEQLGLEAEVLTILRSARIKTVGEIIDLERNRRLLRVRNLGKKHYVAIQAAFSKLGIALDGTLLEQEPKQPEGLKTAAFVDFEHWYVALRKIHNRRPNVQTWFDDLRSRGRLLDVAFFGNFSDDGAMRDELDQIRRFSNHIVETKNIGPHAKANFTDFIMLDNIYQKVISSPEIEQIVLFTGDSDFCSVASYLRNFCGKIVGVYGVDNAISSQLEAISDWCVRIPFSDEPYEECRSAILKNLHYAETHTKSPTFRMTVRMVADRYALPEDAVEAELRLMMDEGLVYTVPERSRRNYTLLLNVLHVKWDQVEEL